MGEPDGNAMDKKNQRGEIVTILTVVTLVVIGITTAVTSYFVSNPKNKQTTSSKAKEIEDGEEAPAPPAVESSSTDNTSSAENKGEEEEPPSSKGEQDNDKPPEQEKKLPECSYCSGNQCLGNGLTECEGGCSNDQDCGAAAPPSQEECGAGRVKNSEGLCVPDSSAFSSSSTSSTENVSDCVQSCNGDPGCEADCEFRDSLKPTSEPLPQEGGDSCFLSGTKVLMANGKAKEIEYVKKNDKLVSFNLTTYQSVIDSVEKTFVHPRTPGGYFLINNRLKVTGNHPVWTNGNSWREVATLQKGDTLLDDQGYSVTVRSMTYIPGTYTVYSLHLSGDDHNYFAEGVLVHNSTTTGKKVKEDDLNISINCTLADQCNKGNSRCYSESACRIANGTVIDVSVARDADEHCKQWFSDNPIGYSGCVSGYDPSNEKKLPPCNFCANKECRPGGYETGECEGGCGTNAECGGIDYPACSDGYSYDDTYGTCMPKIVPVATIPVGDCDPCKYYGGCWSAKICADRNKSQSDEIDYGCAIILMNGGTQEDYDDCNGKSSSSGAPAKASNIKDQCYKIPDTRARDYCFQQSGSVPDFQIVVPTPPNLGTVVYPSLPPVPSPVPVDWQNRPKCPAGQTQGCYSGSGGETHRCGNDGHEYPEELSKCVLGEPREDKEKCPKGGVGEGCRGGHWCGTEGDVWYPSDDGKCTQGALDKVQADCPSRGCAGGAWCHGPGQPGNVFESEQMGCRAIPELTNFTNPSTAQISRSICSNGSQCASGECEKNLCIPAIPPPPYLKTPKGNVIIHGSLSGCRQDCGMDCDSHVVDGGYICPLDMPEGYNKQDRPYIKTPKGNIPIYPTDIECKVKCNKPCDDSEFVPKEAGIFVCPDDIPEEYNAKPTTVAGGISSTAIKFCSANFTFGQDDFVDCVKGYISKGDEPVVKEDSNFFNSTALAIQTCSSKTTPGTQEFESCLADEMEKELEKSEKQLTAQQGQYGGGNKPKLVSPVIVISPLPQNIIAADKCKTQNDVCGEGDGVCQGQGVQILGWNVSGRYECNKCTGSTVAVPGQGCVHIAQAIPQGEKCSQGEMAQVGAKCFMCVANNDSGRGILIGVDSGVCGSVNTAADNGVELRFNGGDILSNEVFGISNEDKGRIREMGYNKVSDEMGKQGDWGGVFGVRAMQFGDWIGGGMGNMGKTMQKGTAAIGGTLYGTDKISILGTELGDKYADAGSNMGDYYLQTLKTKNAIAAECELAKIAGHPEQCREYSVDLKQALLTGVGGGLEYANGLTFGALDGATNLITGNRVNIKKINDNLLTAAYGDNQALKDAALSSQVAGTDLTNAVAMMVPMAKGVGGLSSMGASRLSGAAALLETEGASGLRTAAVTGLKTGSGALRLVEKAALVVEKASPESWRPFTNFVKAAPITTGIETLAKVTVPTRLAEFTVAGRPVGQNIIKTAQAAQTASKVFGEEHRIITGIATAPVKLGEKAFEIMLPRSALTYSADEAAALLARDMKAGLVTDAKQAAARLKNNYHINLGSGGEVDDFMTALAKDNRVSMRFDPPELQNLTAELKSPIIRADNLDQRVRIMEATARVKKNKVKLAKGLITDSDPALKAIKRELKGNYDPAAAAEAALHYFEKQNQGGVQALIANTDRRIEAVAYAQKALEAEAAKGLGIGDRVRAVLPSFIKGGKIVEIEQTILADSTTGDDVATYIDKLKASGFSNDRDTLFKAAQDLYKKMEGKRQQAFADVSKTKGADIRLKKEDILTNPHFTQDLSDLDKRFAKINDVNELADKIAGTPQGVSLAGKTGQELEDALIQNQALANAVLQNRAASGAYGRLETIAHQVATTDKGVLGKVLGKFDNVGNIQKSVVQELDIVADRAAIEASLIEHGFKVGNASTLDKAINDVAEQIRITNKAGRIDSLKAMANDPLTVQARQDVADAVRTNSYGAADQVKNYAKRFKNIKDPDKLAEVILTDMEKKANGGMSLSGYADEQAAALAYAQEVAKRNAQMNPVSRVVARTIEKTADKLHDIAADHIAGNPVEKVVYGSMDALADRLRKGIMTDQQKIFAYMHKNGILVDQSNVQTQLERFGYKGDTRRAVATIDQLERNAVRTRLLQDRVDIFNTVTDAEISATRRVMPAPNQPKDIKYFSQKFKNNYTRAELSEAIMHQWESDAGHDILRATTGNPQADADILRAAVLADDIIKARRAQFFNVADMALDRFGIGRRADLEKQIRAALPDNPSQVDMNKLLTDYGYPKKASIFGKEITINTDAIPFVAAGKKEFGFFERALGYPSKIEDEVFDQVVRDQIVRTGPVSLDPDTIRLTLKQKGYAAADIEKAVARVQTRLKIFEDANWQVAWLPDELPALSSKPLKQKWTAWEKSNFPVIGKKPIKIESQVAQKHFQTPMTRAEIIADLRRLGYAEEDIYAAAERIFGNRSPLGPVSPLAGGGGGTKPAPVAPPPKAPAPKTPPKPAAKAAKSPASNPAAPKSNSSTSPKSRPPPVDTPDKKITHIDPNPDQHVSVSVARSDEYSAAALANDAYHGQDAGAAQQTIIFSQRRSDLEAMLLSADGHGEGGAVASKLAAKRFQTLYDNNSNAIYGATGRRDPIVALQRTIKELNEEIADALRRGRYTQGGTTLTVGIRIGNNMHIAHLGDSRMYRYSKGGYFGGGGLRKLTEDHNWVYGRDPNVNAKGYKLFNSVDRRGRARIDGIMTKKSLGDVDVRNGISPQEAADYVTPDIATFKATAGDIFISGSDSLEKLARALGGENQFEAFITDTIKRYGSDPQAAKLISEAIKKKALALGVNDDISIEVYIVHSN